jgi:hypothetical protein
LRVAGSFTRCLIDISQGTIDYESLISNQNNLTREEQTMLKRAYRVGGAALQLGLLLAVLGGAALAQAPAAATPKLKVGDMAPDFTMAGTDGKTYKLSDFRGQKNVVLAFYVLAFTGG